MATKAAKDDGKKAATEVDPDDFMSKADLKAALAVAEGGKPVPCALGMTRDKRHGLVLLAKRGRGKALMGDLQDTADELSIELDTGSLRYGRASIDPKDPHLVTFAVHKEALGAMWTPIQKRMAKVGYNRINFTTNTDLANEPEEDAPGAAPPTGTADAGQTAAPPAAATAARVKELAGTLAGLLKQIPAVLAITPSLKDNLIKIASAAKTALHEGQTDIAADLIDTLDDELKAAPTAADTTAPNTQIIAGKAQMAWTAYLRIAAREVDKLRTEIAAAYRDHGFGPEVDKFFAAQIDPALQRLQGSDLVAKLAEVASSADAAQQRQKLAEGIQIVETLQGLVASDPVLKKLDDNPFTSLVLAKTAAATLGTLKKTLQTAAKA